MPIECPQTTTELSHACIRIVFDIYSSIIGPLSRTPIHSSKYRINETVKFLHVPQSIPHPTFTQITNKFKKKLVTPCPSSVPRRCTLPTFFFLSFLSLHILSLSHFCLYASFQPSIAQPSRSGNSFAHETRIDL